jgi:hypothetical protein
MKISTANGMIPDDPPDGHRSAHKRRRNNSRPDSLKGSLPRFRVNRLRDAGRRVFGELAAGLRKALEAAWVLVLVPYKRANLLLRGHFPTALVLVLGILISGTGFMLTSNHYKSRSQQAFDRPAAHYTAIVSQTIERYLEVINSVGAFMAASNEVDRPGARMDPPRSGGKTRRL